MRAAERNHPRVSVVVPVFNRQDYIGSAIESVLAQSFADFELLVVDDGSTDRTPEIVQSYRDPRIRLISHPHNLGIPTSRNRGLESARGEYIATLDSDDWAHPQRLQRQVAFLDSHPEHALVGSWIGRINSDGRSYRIQTRPLRAEDVQVQLLFGGAMVNSSTMGRTALLQRFGFRAEFPVRQDFDLFVRLAAQYPLANLPYPLTLCRRHPAQATKIHAALVRDKTLAILGAELCALGVDFDADDLARHYALPRLGRAKLRTFGLDIVPDAVYFDWAEAWLSKLWEANCSAHRYVPAALERELGWLLCKILWQMGTHEGFGSWQKLRRSPLLRMTASGLGHRLRLSAKSSLTRLSPGYRAHAVASAHG